MAENSEKIAPKIQKGQTIWLERLVFFRQHEKNNKELIETTISKVGREYFETNTEWVGRFSIKTLVHDGKDNSPMYKVYFNKEDYYRKVEQLRLFSEIRESFYTYNTKISLEKLREISRILKTDE